MMGRAGAAGCATSHRGGTNPQASLAFQPVKVVYFYLGDGGIMKKKYRPGFQEQGSEGQSYQKLEGLSSFCANLRPDPPAPARRSRARPPKSLLHFE